MGFKEYLKFLEIRPLVMEGIGSLCYVFLGGWSWITVSEFQYRVYTDKTKYNENGTRPIFLPDYSPLTSVGLIHFFMVTILTWVGAPISGGHFNPAITLGFIITKNMQLLTGLFYIASQLAGSLAGTLLFKLLIPSSFVKVAEENNIFNGCPSVHPDVAFFGFVCEAIGGFVLMFIYYAVMIEKRGGKHIFGMAVGAVIGAAVMALGTYEVDPKTKRLVGNISAGALNPSRSFGPTIMKFKIKQWWILIIAPLVGSTLAALIYKFFLHKKEDKDADDEELTIEMD